MFYNYLVTALRNITRHRLYSIINIAGLAVGLACVIFILLFVRDQLSYDKWIPGADHLYRVETRLFLFGGHPPVDFAWAPFPLPEAMKAGIPEVTAMTRLAKENMTVNIGDRQFFDTIDAVDSNFLKVIRLPLLAGDPDTALSQPQSLVLSQTLAKKYFGNANPIGKTVVVGNPDCTDGDEACLSKNIILTVTGVMADLPHNTQLAGDALMPNTSPANKISRAQRDKWSELAYYGFVALAPGANPKAVLHKAQAILDQNMAKDPDTPPGRHKMTAYLTPFTAVHLNSSQFGPNMTPSGSWVTVIGVGMVGVLILLIACFNFMNLATAQALRRAREVALRKCLGATRRQLIVQYLSEAVMVALLAGFLALALAEILQPAFDGLLGRPIGLDYLHDWPLLLIIVAITVAVGLVSGSYPALVLSGFRPGQVLRSTLSGGGKSRLRSILVVLQFAVSIGLGIVMLGVFDQITYARNADLGFRYDQTLVVTAGAHLSPEHRRSFTGLLRANPGVVDTAMSDLVPFEGIQRLQGLRIPGRPGHINITAVSIDPDFSRFYHIRLLAGRMFARDRATDTFSNTPAADNEGHGVILNSTAVAHLGWTPQEAVGKNVIFNGHHVRVIGVLADARFSGTFRPVPQVIYYNDANHNTEISIRLRGGDIPATVGFIDRTWRRFAPNTSPHQHFLDDSFSKLYASGRREGTMFSVFAGLAIFISCLGLFGLAAFAAGRRTKEIGIRKVFGARTRDVLWMLLWQFSIPVLLANVIAWPLAWYYLHGWLEGFAYRISLSPLYFIAAGLVALVIAWATIFVHAWRVARANPIHALRHE